MSVKDLITELQKYPENREVVMYGTKGYCDYMECNEISGLFPVVKVEELTQPWHGKNIGNIKLNFDEK